MKKLILKDFIKDMQLCNASKAQQQLVINNIQQYNNMFDDYENSIKVNQYLMYQLDTAIQKQMAQIKIADERAKAIIVRANDKIIMAKARAKELKARAKERQAVLKLKELKAKKEEEEDEDDPFFKMMEAVKAAKAGQKIIVEK